MILKPLIQPCKNQAKQEALIRYSNLYCRLVITPLTSPLRPAAGSRHFQFRPRPTPSTTQARGACAATAALSTIIEISNNACLYNNGLLVTLSLTNDRMHLK